MQQTYEVLQEIYSSPRVRIEKVRSAQDNQTYVQKTYIQNKNEGLNALQILYQLQNQFVLQVKEYFENDEQQLVFIQEYCDIGDLRAFTLQHIGYKMQESIVWSLFLQMAYALLTFNEQGIHHRVLLPENILLLSRTEGYQIRVTEFHKASKQTLCQLPCAAIYLPFEYFFEGQYTQKSQIWQVGHILYFMVSQKLLFPASTLENQVKEQLRRGRVQVNVPSVYSEGLVRVVNACLQIRERDRPNILQLLRMKEVREALEKPYYVFSLDQRRHLMYWINSTETTISKPVLYSFNEFDLHSPRMTQKDVVVKKTFKNEKLPEIFANRSTKRSRSPERGPSQQNTKKGEGGTTSTRRLPQMMGMTQKTVFGVVKPISYHRKKLATSNQAESQPKFSLAYESELDEVFRHLMESKKSLCATWLGEDEYQFLRIQAKHNKPDKLMNYLRTRHPRLDSSVIMEQISHIVDLEDQKSHHHTRQAQQQD